jgi:hypothetical protein
MKHRIHLIAFESDPTARPWVIGLFQQFGTGGKAEMLNCNEPIASAVDAAGPVIAKCCSFVVGDTTMTRLLDLVAANQVPAGITYVVCDEIGKEYGVVKKTNWPDSSVVGMEFDLAGAMNRVGVRYLTEQRDIAK